MKGANVMKLSIVIPVYFNHDNLLPLYNDLREKVLCKLDCDYEILMVDDGSKDKSYDVICELARLDTHIIPLNYPVILVNMLPFLQDSPAAVAIVLSAKLPTYRNRPN